MEQFNTADKIAAYLGGGLVVFGVVAIGLLEMLFGSGLPSTGRARSSTRRSSRWKCGRTSSSSD
ncbi:hypothetical protein [Halomicrobium mukohataei]|uniref:hypothetical protein n=1 Tax=Halomicrobium mukohataei TaxID=57705 RepID=UPI001F10A797|nr:hypothetical protein [Halomicrobium mukohataei]